jgi:hypothetical protein
MDVACDGEMDDPSSRDEHEVDANEVMCCFMMIGSSFVTRVNSFFKFILLLASF